MSVDDAREARNLPDLYVTFGRGTLDDPLSTSTSLRSARRAARIFARNSRSDIVIVRYEFADTERPMTAAEAIYGEEVDE